MRTLASLAFVVVACGGGSGGGLGTRAITASQAEPLCAADCQRDFDCGFDSDVATCTTSCIDNFVGWARADAVESFLECSSAQTCDVFDEGVCRVGIRPLAIHQEWEAKCRATLSCLGEDLDEACGVTPSADRSALFVLVAPELMPEFIACLDGPECQGRVNCVIAALEAHNIDF